MLIAIFKRLSQCIIMLFLATAIIFIVLEVLPGNTAQILSGPDASPEMIAALAHELGLDQPVIKRYAHWLIGIWQGNLGNSYVYGTPVSELIMERLQVTIPLALLAITITLVAALPLGVYAAAHRGNIKDHLITLFSELGMAIPNFWLAILLILLFTITLQWFPFASFPGWSTQHGGGLLIGLKALLLPASALAIVQTAILTRFVRSSITDVIHENFVRTARAKGLSKNQTLWRHVFKNASIPILTLIGMQLATLISGAIVTENVFLLPGLGRLIFNSIINRDYIVIRNALLLLIAFIMIINMIIDILCLLIDPRTTADKEVHNL